MKNLKLSTKLLLVSGIILAIFAASSSAILYAALTRQANQEMDKLLQNEQLALSALVSSTRDGRFDFELSPSFLSQNARQNPNGFFIFTDVESKLVLRQSSGAPNIECLKDFIDGHIVFENRRYRVSTSQFHPELDNESGSVAKLGTSTTRRLCLLTGLDEAPYQQMVKYTLASSIPWLLALVTILIGTMLFLIMKLTRDLSNLTSALSKEDSNTNYEFPTLGSATTREVKAVVEKLEKLHAQAAEHYRETWLFLGRAAHQIRTPVAAMQATLDVLLRKDRTKDELLIGLEDVKVAARSLSSLAIKLIESSRIAYQQTQPIEAIGLSDFFKLQTESFASRARERGINLKVITHDEVFVRATLPLLNDIFGNLLENAIVYSPYQKNASVHISWKVLGRNVEVEIHDDGPGFSSEVLKTIFQPFVRGNHTNIQGSGLGLSIAKKSASLIGGQITIKTSAEIGTSVITTLVNAAF